MTKYCFKLFLTQQTPEIDEFLSGLKKACGPGNFEIETVNVIESPEKATKNNVWATPTIIKASPSPEQRILGSLAYPKYIFKFFEIEGFK